MESSHQEPQNGAPNKTLETLEVPKDPSPVSSPPLAEPQPMETAVEGGGGEGEDPREAKPSSTEISDLEKKQRRAERFGVPFQPSEEEKRSSRADRFGTRSASSGKNDDVQPGKNDAAKLEDEKRKARAERFGISGKLPDEEAKKKARTEKFAVNPTPVTPEEEEKRKARALRFSVTSTEKPETNGGANSELKVDVAETKE